MAVFQTIGNSFKDGFTANQGSTGRGITSHNINDYSVQYAEEIEKLRPKNVDNNYQPSNRYFDSLTNNKRIHLPVNYDNNEDKYENAFKLPISAITNATKFYHFKYEKMATQVGDYGKVSDAEDAEIDTEIYELDIVPSLFNPLYGISVITIDGNTPIVNGINTPIVNGITDQTSKLVKRDVSDCSIKTLVELSNNDKEINPPFGELGHSIYKYADFMYCKDLGKISNNRLITLRRFPIPVGDDIWHVTNSKDNAGVQMPGDVGRMVTWLNEDNKLESILNYSFQEKYDAKHGEYQEVTSREENPERGYLGAAINLTSPNYRNHIIGGGLSEGNMLLGGLVGRVTRGTQYSGTDIVGMTSAGQNSLSSGNAEAMYDMYDKNRIYEPPATTRDTYINTGELQFNHEFTLVFDYELRAYSNINPKSAFLDLLNNIEQTTYRKGKFWGGAYWWKGAPQDKNGWRTATAFITKEYNKLSDTFTALLKGDMNLGDLLGSLANTISSGISSVWSKATAGGLEDIRKSAAEFIEKNNGAFLGIIQNQLGRPALYAVSSLLTGEPVGLWHVTIGNPRNPIAVMGDMIIDKTQIEQYGPLGLDDFPTGLKVTVSLKHGHARDLVNIEKMYTRGANGIGIPLSAEPGGAIGNFIDFNSNSGKIGKYDENMFATMWASTTRPTGINSLAKHATEAKIINQVENPQP